jgi:hypothetical protein
LRGLDRLGPQTVPQMARSFGLAPAHPAGGERARSRRPGRVGRQARALALALGAPDAEGERLSRRHVSPRGGVLRHA